MTPERAVKAVAVSLVLLCSRFSDCWVKVVLVAVLGVVGKFAAGFGGGKGMRATVIGWDMVPRGEVGLIFVAAGSRLRVGGQPLLDPQVQAGIVGAILLTTIAGPIGLGWALKRR